MNAATLTNQKLKDAFDSQKAAAIAISTKMSDITTKISFKNSNSEQLLSKFECIVLLS